MKDNNDPTLEAAQKMRSDAESKDAPDSGKLDWQPKKPLLARLGLSGKRKPKSPPKAIDKDHKFSKSVHGLGKQPDRSAASFLPRVLRSPLLYVLLACAGLYFYLYGAGTPVSDLTNTVQNALPFHSDQSQAESRQREDNNIESALLAQNENEPDIMSALEQDSPDSIFEEPDGTQDKSSAVQAEMDKVEQSENLEKDVMVSVPESGETFESKASQPEQAPKAGMTGETRTSSQDETRASSQEQPVAEPAPVPQQPVPGSKVYSVSSLNRALSDYHQGQAVVAITQLDRALDNNSIHHDYRGAARNMLEDLRYLASLYQQAMAAHWRGDRQAYEQTYQEYIRVEQQRYGEVSSYYHARLVQLRAQQGG